MRVPFGRNALNSQITSVLLCNGTRFALALPGDRCTFQGSQILQGLNFTYIPLLPVSHFYDLCLWHSSSSLHSSVTPTYLPAFRVVSPSDVGPRETWAPWLALCSCSLRAVLHSKPVCSSPYDTSLDDWWIGQSCPCKSCLHREIKAASASCDDIHHMSKEPFPLPSLMTPSPYFRYKQR